MKYACEKCIHRYPLGGCLVPSNLGYVEQCKHFMKEEPKPMTNEEYIRSCSTEELAWFIAKAMLFYDNTTMSLLDAIKKAMEYDKKASDYFTDDIVEWLKQPHREE